MKFDINQIRNKQRILITGNKGVAEILDLIEHVFTYIGKEYCIAGGEVSNAPVFILALSDQKELEGAVFANFEPHVLLIHEIKEKYIPDGYDSFENYIDQFEDVADSLPKAGSYIYNEDDDVANMIGTKAREDVNNLKYNKLVDKDLPVYLRDKEASFLEHASAALALLKRMGVKEDQFFEALSKK